MISELFDKMRDIVKDTVLKCIAAYIRDKLTFYYQIMGAIHFNELVIVDQ